MLSNIYNVLAGPPILEEEGMALELEALAQRLTQSGRLRIDADDRANFVRYSLPYDDVYRVFSRRDLYDPALIPQTEQLVRKTLAPHTEPEALDEQVNADMAYLRNEISKHLEVEREFELKIARLLVQSAHPAVIQLLLWEEVEIFISYEQTIGEMLDIHSWQVVGRNSGMQSTGSNDFAVYVSSGGHPFFRQTVEGVEPPTEWNASMARLMVIAAQELGHYSDVIRNAAGRPAGRVSANLQGTKANPPVAKARLDDDARTEQLEKTLLGWGMEEAAQTEKGLEFYKKHRPKDRIVGKTTRELKRQNVHIIKKAQKAGMDWITTLPKYSTDGELFARQLVMLCRDMRFNLTPQADAYRRDDPDEEEAIACIEALARVPQQAVKWGHAATYAFWPQLYTIYYKEVVPGCIKTLENMTGQPYHFSLTYRKKAWWKKLPWK